MSSTVLRNTLSQRTVTAAQDVLAGRHGGRFGFLTLAGPAVMASVAYMDPGNFATNIQAGAHYGYALLWVVVLANLIAMLFQALSAKLGIVTGMSLAEQCRAHFDRRLVIAMWLASEIGAMATDLAEFLGGAIGFSLLFGLPLFASLVLTAVITYVLLVLGNRGFRPVELVIGGFVLVIGLGYAVELALAPPDWGAFALGVITPRVVDLGGMNLAVAIVGATVMPHAIYLHSGLSRDRVPVSDSAQRRLLVRFSNREVLVALGFAGLVNLAMIAMAASMFHAGHADVAEIETAYRTLVPLFGGAAAIVFMISLLASGLSSSVVGTLAGQMIMQDFVHFKTPLWARRLLTMLPAFVVVALGVNATQSLVYSQVILSLVLPVPMIALVVLIGRREVMGEFVSSRKTRILAISATTLVLALNLILILQVLGMV